MTVINKLATSLNRRDEMPNKELAKEIARKTNKEAVKELVAVLHGKNKPLQSDAIKVIYELGELQPGMLVDFSKEFIALLNHKSNRLRWGAMIALDKITSEIPGKIYKELGRIIAAADEGSVITNDHCVGILVKLCKHKRYAEDAFALLNERIKISPPNQFPTYAENAFTAIDTNTKATLLQTLQERLPGMEQGTKRLRVEKLVKKLTAMK